MTALTPLSPVRAAPRPEPPPGPGARRPRPALPRVSGPTIIALTLVALLGWGALAWSIWPRPRVGVLHAPIAQALNGACVTDPSLCSGRVASTP